MNAAQGAVLRELADCVEGFTDNEIWSWQQDDAKVTPSQRDTLTLAAAQVMTTLRLLSTGRLVLVDPDAATAPRAHRPRSTELRAILAGGAQWQARRTVAGAATP